MRGVETEQVDCASATCSLIHPVSLEKRHAPVNHDGSAKAEGCLSNHFPIPSVLAGSGAGSRAVTPSGSESQRKQAARRAKRRADEEQTTDTRHLFCRRRKLLHYITCDWPTADCFSVNQMFYDEVILVTPLPVCV